MNAITTKHNLDFLATHWHRDPRVMVYKVGTCSGQYQFIDGKLVLISVINDQPGNGHLDDVFEWFEFAARSQHVPLVIAEFFNDRFKKHCIDKRGFKQIPGTDNVIKKYPNHDTSRFRKKFPARKLPKRKKPEPLTCPVCNGKGRRIDAKTKEERMCAACKGEGRVKK